LATHKQTYIYAVAYIHIHKQPENKPKVFDLAPQQEPPGRRGLVVRGPVSEALGVEAIAVLRLT